jgi:hypothetical protein
LLSNTQINQFPFYDDLRRGGRWRRRGWRSRGRFGGKFWGMNSGSGRGVENDDLEGGENSEGNNKSSENENSDSKDITSPFSKFSSYYNKNPYFSYSSYSSNSKPKINDKFSYSTPSENAKNEDIFSYSSYSSKLSQFNNKKKNAVEGKNVFTSLSDSFPPLPTNNDNNSSSSLPSSSYWSTISHSSCEPSFNNSSQSPYSSEDTETDTEKSNNIPVFSSLKDNYISASPFVHKVLSSASPEFIPRRLYEESLSSFSSFCSSSSFTAPPDYSNASSLSSSESAQQNDSEQNNYSEISPSTSLSSELSPQAVVVQIINKDSSSCETHIPTNVYSKEQIEDYIIKLSFLEKEKSNFTPQLNPSSNGSSVFSKFVPPGEIIRRLLRFDLVADYRKKGFFYRIYDLVIIIFFYNIKELSEIETQKRKEYLQKKKAGKDSFNSDTLFSYSPSSSKHVGNSSPTSSESVVSTNSSSFSSYYPALQINSSVTPQLTYASVLAAPPTYYPTVPSLLQLNQDSFLYKIRVNEERKINENIKDADN